MMKPSVRIPAVILAAAAILGSIVSVSGLRVSAQMNLLTSSSATPSPSPSPSPTPEATPVPLPAVVLESENVARRLEEIRRKLSSDSSVSRTQASLDPFKKRVEESEGKAVRGIEGLPSLETIRELEEEWKAFRERLDLWQLNLRTFAEELDSIDAELARRLKSWEELRSSVRVEADSQEVTSAEADVKQGEQKPAADESPAATPTPAPEDVPGAIRLRIEEAIQGIEAVQKEVAAKRVKLLELQADVSKEEERINGMLERIDEERKSALSNLFTAESPLLWDPASFREEFTGEFDKTFRGELSSTGRYLTTQIGGFIFMVFVFLIILATLRIAKRKTRKFVEEEPDLERPLVFFNMPLVFGSLVALYLIIDFFPKMPELLEVILTALILVPAYVILRRILDPPLYPVLNVLTGLYFFDEFRSLFEAYPFVSRLLLALQLMAAMGVILWIYRRIAEGSNLAESYQRLAGFLRKALVIAAVFLLVAFFADLSGLVSLARLLSKGVLGSAYSALFLYALYLLIGSFCLYLMLVRPLSRLRMVRHRRGLVLEKLRKIFAVLLVIIWIQHVLGEFYLSTWFESRLGSIVSYEFTLGSFSISLSDILVFLFVVWLAFALSRLVRFVLEEDVYSRVRMADGVPYAVSTILHYILLLAGFSLAILSLGIDLTKFTILAGAFGVGLGFGLQNIVENFVSGVILLFERPITVGDVIQRGQQVGDLKRIGLRASVLGTPEGAEVIVPNGVLLSEEVTNWTPASHYRRLDVNVGVKYGSDPEEVMALLVEIGKQHPEVVADPEPVALFVGFGDNALDFQLRTWADSDSKWWRIRSDLSVGVYKALNEAGIDIPFPQRDLNLKGVDSESLIGLLNKKHEDRKEEGD